MPDKLVPETEPEAATLVGVIAPSPIVVMGALKFIVTPCDPAKSELIKSIKESSSKIEFLDTDVESILKLPEKK